MVHLKGLVKGGTVSTSVSGGRIFVLPCGYGPAQDELHPALSNDAVGRVSIVSFQCSFFNEPKRYFGMVVAQPPSNSAWVSLDGITFRAATS